jgi:uncharacterized protein (DUF885 family)
MRRLVLLAVLAAPVLVLVPVQAAFRQPVSAQDRLDAVVQKIARPGYFIGYFMGMSEILKMRDEYRSRMGAGFTLKAFHQRLLEIGSMPPALVREVLLAP